MSDESASRSQRRRQHALNATRPIGSIDEVTVELEHLLRQVNYAEEALALHRQFHRNAIAFPWFFPFGEQRERILRAETARLAAAEDAVTLDVVAVVHRASSIVQRLRAKAAGVDADVLLCSDLAEALVLNALLRTDREAQPGPPSPLRAALDFDVVAAALEDVKVQRVDHTMDDLIERARAVAEAGAAIVADLARAKQERRR